MAHWILEGRAPMDVWSVNLAAHASLAGQRPVSCRTASSNRSASAIKITGRSGSRTTARGVKKSVLHDRLAAAGACFGESAGWERPNWYARPGQRPPTNTAGDVKTGFPTMREEHAAVRERVGVFEQSSFAKLLVQGRDAVNAPEPHRDRQCRRRRRPLRVHPISQRRGGHRGGPDDHPSRRRPLPGGHGGFHANARRGLDTQPNSRQAPCAS